MIRQHSKATLTTFDRLCKAVQAKDPPGITLTQLGNAGALARELGKDEPDPEKVELFTKRLGLEPGEVGK